MSNFRVDSELIKSTRGNSGIMYNARIQAADITGLEGGVPNGTLLLLGALETGQREIRKAVKPTATALPCIVIRGEVNSAEYVKTDDLWGKFRNNVKNPLPVAQLSVGDTIGLSESFFPSADIATLAVGTKYTIASNFIAGTQLVKSATPTAGNVVFEVVELKDNMLPTYILSDGTLTKPYKMVAVEVKIAA